eukprot:CAMPEP_0172363238 /NCGR_PEP_ID=MMETSP1060-20121228/6656_1 /TAXON_ID=37318 /ORGANISM="Pseudo-nitzschia pungens, Strain cf. cingulata" /LENGTH=736 /DNA_ID=CAMNT_0013085941 /DNA_START=800 /DNA_END=3010 /DNA_ORIENTATION=+
MKSPSSSASAETKQSEDSPPIATTNYNPPPASWFFGRGNSNNNNKNKNDEEKEKEENTKDSKHESTVPTEDLLEKAFSSPKPEEAAMQTDSSLPLPSKIYSPDLGIVSDHEDDNEETAEEEAEADDHEGFNFIAVTNSLLMAGHSFEDVADQNNNGATDKDEDKEVPRSSPKFFLPTEHGRGVLIVDGEDEAAAHAPGSSSNTNTNTNTNDASILTVPGSDSLPSEIGTISHPDESEDVFFGDPDSDAHDSDANTNANQSPGPAEVATVWDGSPLCLPLVHGFLKNLHQQSRRRLWLVAEDDEQEDNQNPNANANASEGGNPRRFDVPASVDRVVWWTTKAAARLRARPFSESAVMLSSSARKHRLLLLVLIAISAASWTGRAVWHRQKALQFSLRDRLRMEMMVTEQLTAEREQLRHELQELLEETAVAHARANSLVLEQERWLDEKRLLEKAAASAEAELERMKDAEEKRRQRWETEEARKHQNLSKKKQQQRPRRKQDAFRTSSSDDDGGFSWFFDDANESCSGPRHDEQTSFTFADNCWFKGSVGIDLGPCGGESKDYFKGIWNGLWDDWGGFDFYGFDTSDSMSALKPYTSSSRDEGPERDDSRRGQDGADGDPQLDSYPNTDDTYYPPQDPLKELYSIVHAAGQSVVTKLTQLVTEEPGDADETSDPEAVAGLGEEMAWSDGEYSKLLSSLRALTKPGEKSTRVTRTELVDTAAALASLSKAWQESSARE